ncbi:hypothetical protein ACJRO7_010158 [Eucalyptus globulus]|uniref:Secreted protein n=1 Tax=Eucalyptus globulus TaxID=34317 RepID=A0ABD3LC78_EUCGL
MNAFKACKACLLIAWSPNLYITLVRGIPGIRRLHWCTLEEANHRPLRPPLGHEPSTSPRLQSLKANTVTLGQILLQCSLVRQYSF